MSSKSPSIVVMTVIVVSLIACGSEGPPAVSTQGGALPAAEGFTATAASAVRVDLSWAPVSSATGYLIEAKYDSGDYFLAAQLPADATSYPHFIVPGSGELGYRLSAETPAGNQPVGTASVSPPELTPNPVVITGFEPFLPEIGGGDVDLSAMPTLDPVNPDPSAMATMAAMAEGLAVGDPESLLEDLAPLSVSESIGPEGGTIELTDPNGVIYRLEVPSGSLDAETLFRLDPFQGAGDFPLSKVYAALNIHPPVEFSVPLRLTILFPEEPAADKVLAFDVSHFDGELSLAPVYQDGNGFTMNVYWGDVVGIAGGSLEEVLAQGSRIPTDAAGRISQQLAVMQALTDDRSPESVEDMLIQVLEGLVQSSRETSDHPTPGAGRLAAPLSLQQGESGLGLWQRLSEFRRTWSEGGLLGFDQGAGPFAAKEPILLVDISKRLKDFLDSHQGCRTSDDFYAQALLRLLRNPEEGSFEERLAENFASRFGNPKNSKRCSYRLHVVTSTIVVDNPEQTTTMRVHVDPFEMTVNGYGPNVFLSGGGQVTYEVMTQRIKKCGPTDVQLTPPAYAQFWVSELRPMFGSQDGADDFYLVGVEAGQSGATAKEIVAQTGKECGQRARVKTTLPDLWGASYAVYHQQRADRGSWEIAGGSSYVATYTESRSYEDSGFRYSVNITMVLTVNQEGQ